MPANLHTTKNKFLEVGISLNHIYLNGVTQASSFDEALFDEPLTETVVDHPLLV
ncbi:hypothetical protein D3C85_1377520 [compost metagenome]